MTKAKKNVKSQIENANPEQQQEAKKPRARGKSKKSIETPAESAAPAEAPPVAEVVEQAVKPASQPLAPAAEELMAEAPAEQAEPAPSDETDEDEVKVKVGRRLTREERQRLNSERLRRREERRLAKLKADADNGGKEPDYPKAVQCFYHEEEPLDVSDGPDNTAFGLAPEAVKIIARQPISQQHPLYRAVQAFVRLASHYNVDVQPPAICQPMLAKLTALFPHLIPLCPRPRDAEDFDIRREELFFGYKKGFLKWVHFAQNVGQNKGEGSWRAWEKVVENHHPGLKKERNPEKLHEEFSPTCMNQLRFVLMDSGFRYRGSEAEQLLKKLQEMNNLEFEQIKLDEAAENARLAAENRAKTLGAAQAAANELLELSPEAPQTQLSEEEQELRELLWDAVMGRLSTQDHQRHWGSFLEEFRDNLGQEVECDLGDRVGTIYTVRGTNNSAYLRVLDLPFRAVRRDGTRVVNRDSGKGVFVSKPFVIPLERVPLAMEMREEFIFDTLLKQDPSLTPQQLRAIYEDSEDDHDAWREGVLSLGKLWPTALRVKVENYLNRNPDGPPQRRKPWEEQEEVPAENSRGRRQHRREESEDEQDEQAQAEGLSEDPEAQKEAFLNGKLGGPTTSLGDKLRANGRG